MSTLESRRIVVPAKNVRKGRVLLLHGWAQNAAVFLSKTKTLTKKLTKAGYDCVFLEAPHVLPRLSAHEKGRENARAWFYYSATSPTDTSASQSGQPMTYTGVNESLELIQNELSRDDSSSFCALFGFSQGGVFVHYVSQWTEQASLVAPSGFQAVIVASGFASQHVGDHNNSVCTTDHILKLPSLHLIGKNDTSVRPELSETLAKLYRDSESIYHEKGHFVPQKSAETCQIVEFLDKHRDIFLTNTV